jgi:hypothetical protein
MIDPNKIIAPNQIIKSSNLQSSNLQVKMQFTDQVELHPIIIYLFTFLGTICGVDKTVPRTITRGGVKQWRNHTLTETEREHLQCKIVALRVHCFLLNASVVLFLCCYCILPIVGIVYYLS